MGKPGDRKSDIQCRVSQREVQHEDMRGAMGAFAIGWVERDGRSNESAKRSGDMHSIISGISFITAF